MAAGAAKAAHRPSCVLTKQKHVEFDILRYLNLATAAPPLAGERHIPEADAVAFRARPAVALHHHRVSESNN